MSSEGPRRGVRLVWPRPGITEVEHVAFSAPADNSSVMVEVSTSVISPGTERARYLGLPNASIGFPHAPGYMAAGTVIESSASVAAGTVVAVRGAPHQSVVNAPESHCHPIPPGVDALDGALWQLGVTALHGLRRGGYRPGAPVAFVGGGLLGLIARRAALAQESPCVVVARSAAKAWAAASEAVPFHLASNIKDEGLAGRWPLVVDATGAADGLDTAISLAADNGTVVLLGSPRAATAPFDAGAVYERGLRIVGAHIDTVEAQRAATGRDLLPELSTQWFRLLEQGMSFRDVLEVVQPAAASHVYRRLCFDSSFIGAAFDWSSPSEVRDHDRPMAKVRREGRRLGIAVLGCGDIGFVDAAATAQSRLAAVVACYDPAGDVAIAAARAHRAAAEWSLDAVLARDDVDAVLIATPHDTHEPLALASLRAGKHVLLEKPVAANVRAAARVADAVARSGLVGGVLFPLRLDARFVAAAHAVQSGSLGRPIGLLSSYLVDKPPSYFFGGYSGRSPTTWRLSKERSGGGVLIMNLLHHIDAARALIGGAPGSVVARTAPSDASPEIEDLAALVVELDGVVATFVGAGSVVGGPGEELRLWGDAGQARVLPDWEAHSRLGSTPEVDAADADPRVVAIDDFAEAVEQGRSPVVTVEDALVTQAVVEAAYQSAAQGGPVSVSDVLAEVGR